MFCPSCGQQQISTETKFCSRCGMPLGIVAEVLAHGGFLPQLAELYKKKKSILTRKNGMGFALIWLIFFLLIVTPFFGIVGAEEMAGVSAIFAIFGGLIIFVSSLIFMKKEIPQIDQSAFGFRANPGLPHQQQHATLPSNQSIPASAYSTPRAVNWRDTNDLEPASVTERTTRLLEKD